MTTTLPARPRFPRWAKVTLGLLAAVLVLCGFFVAWMLTAVAGGLDDLNIGSGRVTEEDDRVVAAREVAERELAAQSAALSAALGIPPVAQASQSDCAVGQHNWKRNDDFDLDCTHGSGVLLAASPDHGFRADAVRLHESLLADGWSTGSVADLAPTGSHIPAVLEEYWDQRTSFPDPAYSPGHLPAAAYTRGGTDLVVAWISPAAPSAAGYPFHDAVWRTPDGAREAESLGAVVPAGSYATVLTLRTGYFRE